MVIKDLTWPDHARYLAYRRPTQVVIHLNGRLTPCLLYPSKGF